MPKHFTSLVITIILSILFLVSLQAKNENITKLPSQRILAGYYATPGTFSLVSNTSNYVQSNPGVYITVYFADTDGGSGSLDFAQKEGILMLGLYTSQTTLVVEECQNFDSYNCSAFQCTEYPDQTSNIAYTDFQVTNGYLGNAQVFIDSNYWNLNTTVLFATDCQPYKGSLVGGGLNGVLGMGIKGDAFKNYATTLVFDSIMGGTETFHHETPPVFSVYLNQGGKSGELIFANDAANKATSEEPLAVLTATSDWIVENVTSVQVGDDITISLSTNLIFDINAAALGLPLDIYRQVLTAIDDKMNALTCENIDTVNYRPECTYGGDLGLLPSIYINVGGQTLEIPGTVYAEVVKILDLPSNKIILNLRGLSQNNKDYSFITQGFENYVILDQHVMGYFYTVFDTAGYNTSAGVNTVKIRVYEGFYGSSKTALIIILVCTVLGLIIGLSIYRYRMIKKAQRMAARSVYGATGPNYVELSPVPNRLS